MLSNAHLIIRKDTLSYSYKTLAMHSRVEYLSSIEHEHDHQHPLHERRTAEHGQNTAANGTLQHMDQDNIPEIVNCIPQTIDPIPAI